MNCSVLLSVYNGEATLDRCFESLLKQTRSDFRIVCVDDASTDKTSEILKKWRDTFGDRLRILENQETIGLTRSLNTGLTRIETPFTARIDADDWWHPEKLERQLDFLKNHPGYGLVGCNYKNVLRGKERPVRCQETDDAIKKSLFNRNPFAHSCVIFDTALVKKVGGYDNAISYGQDYDLWLRLLPYTKFYNVQEYLCFRNAESGISFEKQNAQMRQCIKTQIRYMRKYHASPIKYLSILDPLLVIMTPKCIKDFKRKFF